MHSDPSHMGEFDLIERFFKNGQSSSPLSASNPSVRLGIGDDCALIDPPEKEHIAITTDMLVEGRHFFTGANPEQLGHKALAVNLSDLAAMGAKPLGFTLALALPSADTAWLEGFSKGLLALAKHFDCPLIGGDTTAGPLTISITAIGSIPFNKPICRSGAKVGDEIWVSGTVGDARLALAALRHECELPAEDFQIIESRLHQPTPRIALGLKLRGVANAALDISDGLLGDLKHILNQSSVNAKIVLARLPKSSILQKQEGTIQDQFAASGGDDYELCFTAPSENHDVVLGIGKSLNLPVTCIGKIVSIQKDIPQIELVDPDGNALDHLDITSLLQSFDHFAK